MRAELIEQARDAFLWTTWRIQMTMPSMLGTGEAFSLRITAFAPDGLPSAAFDREIIFEHSPGVEGLPKSVRFDRSGQGHLTIDNLRAVGPDYATVIARPEGCPGVIFSNPAWVPDDPPYRIYWGDLHFHTTYSNCCQWSCKDPEFGYAYARDAAHLDFAAAADHLRGIASQAGRWTRLQELVRLYDLPGTFVPFLAFESSHRTGMGGDNNVYFLDWNSPYFWVDRDDMRGSSPAVPLRQLWDFLDSTGRDYFTVPHHTGRAGKFRTFTRADAYDRHREPLFEIYSAWGSSERRCNRFPLHGGNTDEPAYFSDALRAGCRYGVIASSDDHCTLPGGEGHNWSTALAHKPLSGYRHHGLAAVYAESLSRSSLWQAMTARRCYGTTFVRTLLDVTIGDIGMGQEASISRGDSLNRRRRVRVRVAPYAAAPVQVVLMRNGEQLENRTVQPGQADYHIVFEDDAELGRIAVRDAPFHPEPFVVYYVRVEDRYNQTQWSSPIWLDV